MILILGIFYLAHKFNQYLERHAEKKRAVADSPVEDSENLNDQPIASEKIVNEISTSCDLEVIEGEIAVEIDEAKEAIKSDVTEEECITDAQKISADDTEDLSKEPVTADSSIQI